MKKFSVHQLEKIGHFLMFLLLLEAFLPLWRNMIIGDFDPVEGDPTRRTMLLVGYLGLLPFLMLSPQKAISRIIQTPLPWLLAILAILSILWSGVPDLTFRRSIAILLTTTYGLTLAVRLSFDEFLDILGWALLVCLISSIFMVIFIPDWGIGTYRGENAWRGIFSHKNSLGNKAALSFLVMLTLWLRTNKKLWKRWVWGIGIILAVFLLVGSNSATGLVLFFVMLVGFILLHFLRMLRLSLQIVLPPILILGGLVAVVLVENFEAILVFLERGATMTGRIPLWQNIIPLAVDRFWLGYGLNSFWLGWEGPSAQIWAVSGWQPGYAHNGYLDLWLSLGIIGLTLGVILLFYLLIYSFYFYIIKRLDTQFWILFLIFVFLLNFSEGTLLRSNSIWWVMIVYFASMIKIRVKPKPELSMGLLDR